jgi:hypothetical protein
MAMRAAAGRVRHAAAEDLEGVRVAAQRRRELLLLRRAFRRGWAWPSAPPARAARTRGEVIFTSTPSPHVCVVITENHSTNGIYRLTGAQEMASPPHARRAVV